MSNYKPKPVDTSSVVLPEEIETLTETLAKNVHDIWAKSRMDEGWIYGEEKDSKKKITPNLVPYEELPESEKKYDRDTALQSIKLLLYLGYTISK